jgi:CheY-like chemotaxis protein
MSQRKRILIVDDNDDSLDVLEVLLYNEYEIQTAHNGFEALKETERLIPDLIITDIMMPVMDGIRLFNELRKREPTRMVPIIAFTSFSETASLASLRNLGFNEVLAKPFDNEILLETVTAVLQSRQGQPPPLQPTPLTE